MRLINVYTLELELFPDLALSRIPHAILSHTWRADEVDFNDMRDLAVARSKKGFSKTEEPCRMAISHGLRYAWVDTCCIDKSSSAELSEAMNSMIQWYRQAAVCYAFLSDLPVSGEIRGSDSFGKCRWFTRGWTLQELIAPADVRFFDQAWSPRGTKKTLCSEVSKITGISETVLGNQVPLSTIPLARRMSWAAGRQTTRAEDLAYCLLGIFDVNISMIYGEGSKAFVRLQEEILRKTTDLSLFAWVTTNTPTTEYRGILAESPCEFPECGNITLSDDQFRFRDKIVPTNKGIKINAALQHVLGGLYVFDLHCYEEVDGPLVGVGIYLQRALDTYSRCLPHIRASAPVVPGRFPRPIYLALTTDQQLMAAIDAENSGYRIYIDISKGLQRYRVSDFRAIPERYWQADEQYFSVLGLNRFSCSLRFCITPEAALRTAGYSTANGASTKLILVCNLAGETRLRMSLYTETGLLNISGIAKEEEFIDPLKDIRRYGRLGDSFTLSLMSPGNQEKSSAIIKHKDQRLNYVVSTHLAQTWLRGASFQITVRVSS